MKAESYITARTDIIYRWIYARVRKDELNTKVVRPILPKTPNRALIHERPTVVADKTRFGAILR